jgi:serine/threonine protein kinase
MFGQLVVIAGPDQGRTFNIAPGQTLVIGRGQTTETKLRDPHVSRTHCQVAFEGDDRIVLRDSGSASGTLVNGQKVTGERPLKPGDVIRVGETQLRFQFEDIANQSTQVPLPATAKVAPPPAARQLTELSGTTLSHFEVGPVLARARTGVVFQARDTKDNRTVAFKVLLPEYSKNDEEMQRFVRAVKTVLPLRHPNLIALYGAGKTGPHCWIAMEFVEGESLTQVIQRIGTAGMLDWRHALRVAIHVARALDFAQQHAIIHRNITPTNIMVRSSDKLTKLGDLLLAKALEGNLAAEQITRPGELLGDVAYMSPERTRGSGDVDGRSDIYSLGATVYALLTGRPPCEGGSLVETITKIRQVEPVKPKKYQLSIPDLFEGTVLRMLAKRPEDRFAKPADLLTDLERVAKYQGVQV